MEARGEFFYPSHSICADDSELKIRGLKKTSFDKGSNAKDPKVAEACSDCPVQVECFDDAVEMISRGLRIIGVRAGVSATDIGRATLSNKDMVAMRSKLVLQQHSVREDLRPSA